MHKRCLKKGFFLFTSIFLSVVFVGLIVLALLQKDGFRDKEDVTFYVPDGAPALACAELLFHDNEQDGIEYKVISANGIESYVTSSYESRNADFCVLPLTDASLLLNEGDRYQALGVLTHGNFFVISENEETVYTRENLSALLGKKIGFVQLGKLPGLVFRSILEQAGIEYSICSDLSSCQENVVNLINIPPTSVIKGAGYDLFVMPEPAVSVKIEKGGFYEVGNVQELYGAGYAQAILVAKRSIIEQKPKIVEKVVEKLRTNNEFLVEKSATDILSTIHSHLEKGITPAFTSANLNEQTIARCGVYFTDGEDAKREIISTIERIQSVDMNAVKTFSGSFFR